MVIEEKALRLQTAITEFAFCSPIFYPRVNTSSACCNYAKQLWGSEVDASGTTGWHTVLSPTFQRKSGTAWCRRKFALDM